MCLAGVHVEAGFSQIQSHIAFQSSFSYMFAGKKHSVQVAFNNACLQLLIILMC